MIAPNFTEWLEYEPYIFNANKKTLLLSSALGELTQWHLAKCDAYTRILAMQGIDGRGIRKLEDVPYLPVRLFKEFDLLSIDREQIFKTMMSSGTTGQDVSKIYLDRDTASFQTKVLSRLVSNLLGKKRLPMLIIDSPSVLKDRLAFSARGAGILGFSLYGQDVTYALNDSMDLDLPTIEAFLARHKGSPIFIFGFTFMIWQYFILPLRRLGITLPISMGIVLHGGGWKKLQDHAVDNGAFKEALKSCAGVSKVINYYGMVEQTGSLFMECEEGYLHAPIYADVIVRNSQTFELAKAGEEGIIEVLSIIPRSYPGHALLTEDIGVIIGEDNCSCGRLGKYFKVNGRVASAELRGCSDTYEANT